MSETQSGTNGDAQTDDQLSTWGDVDDTYRNLTPPDDVSAEDPLNESEVDEWIGGMYDRIDQRDLEAWQALSSEERSLELLGLYADRGSDTNDAGRSNARGGQGSSYLVDEEEIARRRERIESGEIEVPAGGDPFAESNEKQADRSAMQTEGGPRVNAGREAPDIPAGGDPFGAPQSKSETRENSRTDAPSLAPESRESKLQRVNAAAEAIYEKLETDGPQTIDGLASAKSNLSRLDIQRPVNQLRSVGLVEDVAVSHPPEFAPVHDSQQNARSEKFDEL